MIANKTLFIISAYYPSGNNDQNLRYDFEKLFYSLDLQSTNNYYVLAGDLNSKHSDWGNTTNNSKGFILKKWLEDYEIAFRCKIYASNNPSFPRTSSYLDIFICDCRLHIANVNSNINCLETFDYDSDHNAIQMNIAFKSNEEFTFFKEEEIIKYNYNGTNWKTFNKKITKISTKEINIPNN